jgi:hypothetical protein
VQADSLLTSQGYLDEKTVHRHDMQEEFGNTKWVTRIPKSMGDRQNNGQKKKDKRTNNNL